LFALRTIRVLPEIRAKMAEDAPDPHTFGSDTLRLLAGFGNSKMKVSRCEKKRASPRIGNPSDKLGQNPS